MLCPTRILDHNKWLNLLEESNRPYDLRFCFTETRCTVYFSKAMILCLCQVESPCNASRVQTAGSYYHSHCAFRVLLFKEFSWSGSTYKWHGNGDGSLRWERWTRRSPTVYTKSFPLSQYKFPESTAPNLGSFKVLHLGYVILPIWIQFLRKLHYITWRDRKTDIFNIHEVQIPNRNHWNVEKVCFHCQFH